MGWTAVFPARAEPSRGFLCFTKFVKCCAALNKRLNLTVNLLSRSASACCTKSVKGYSRFSPEEKKLFRSFFNLNVSYLFSRCVLPRVNSSDMIKVDAPLFRNSVLIHIALTTSLCDTTKGSEALVAKTGRRHRRRSSSQGKM